jgi:DNA-binding IclR family transcriptional regulator
VLSDGAALYIDQVAGSSALQPHNWVGQRIPLHATSNGKVLLSGLPDSEWSRWSAAAHQVHACHPRHGCRGAGVRGFGA